MRLVTLQILSIILFTDPCWALGRITETNEPYPVTHSQYAAQFQGRTYRLSWLDNDRVLFVGEPKAEVLARFGEDKRIKPGAKLPKIRFYIWDTRANKAVTYKELSEPFHFCYNEVENFIRYEVPSKKNAVMEGPFGEEREIQINPEEHTVKGRMVRGVFFNELTCREHRYAPTEIAAVGRVVPLHLDHGVLDIWGARADDLRPIRLISVDYRLVKELPLSRRAINPQDIYFSKYKNAYVLFGSTAPPTFSNVVGQWPKNINQPIYLLSPDGSLTIGAENPWTKNFGRALLAFFTPAGFIYTTGSHKNQGVFLVQGNQSVKLLNTEGAVIAGGVSPDGCNIAIAISMDAANSSGGLKNIQVCRRGKQ